MGVFAAKGTLLKIGDAASPEVFTTIAHLTNFPGPENSREVYDVTALDSAGGYKEYIGGLRDGGEVTAEGFFDAADAGQSAARTNLTDEDVAHNFELVLPTAQGKKWSFVAWCTKFSHAHPVNGVAACSITLRITGKPTLVSA